MAGSIDDVDRVFDVMAGRDDDDAWSRDRGPRYGGGPIRVGLPPVDELEFFGDAAMRDAHMAFRDAVRRTCTVVDVSLEPFLAAGSLLYQGPWVAERLVEFGDFLAAQPDSIHPVVREILRGGQKYTAVDTFAALQRLAELKASVARLWQTMDVLVVPTIGTTFTVDEVLAAPIDCNTMLGHYTHFGNLLDLLGVAIPFGTTPDGRPYSAMLLGAALTDDTVLQFAAQLLDEPREASSPRIHQSRHRRGAHMSQPIEVAAEPSPFTLIAGKTALIVIDMQRDFLLPGGFGESLGNDVSRLLKVVPPLEALIAAARSAGIMVIHTREGHRARPFGLPAGQAQPRSAVETDRRPGQVRPHPDPRRVRPRHRRRTRAHRR